MQAVTELRDARQATVPQHPFFAWLRSDSVPLGRRLDFAPAAALFIMQFRDMNLWAHRYPHPSDEYQWVINRGTIEDSTHSRLFVDDWRALGLDQRLGWRASDTLWWLCGAGEQEPVRRAGMRYLSFAVADEGNPFVRYAHSEAGEATGHVFLSHTAPIATALTEATGRDYRYFGHYHLRRESGHVANTEGVFETRVLSQRDRAAALRACAGMFDLFDTIFTCWLAYARRYVETGSAPARPAAGDRPGVPPAPADLTPLYEDPRSAAVAW